ncbi:SMC-Scp complex subunit ScpB [Rhodoplanes azumiensis]|uniref:SMC-Scp complex subunit ScpB n=1 Tax=Rhodoplanes azumiensis TaxID=1897628 RepID=A0ABW5AFG7_9BRAD
MIPENEAGRGEVRKRRGRKAETARDAAAPAAVEAVAEDTVAEDRVSEDAVAEVGAADELAVGPSVTAESTEGLAEATDETSDETSEETIENTVVDAVVVAEPEVTVETAAETQAVPEVDDAALAAVAPTEEGAAQGPEARPDELRLLEALLFAASEPVEEKALAKRLPAGTDVKGGLKRLQLEYAPRGVNLVRIGTKWAFRTANDLAWLLTHEAGEPKKLSRAAVETLAIIAYHQPVTRAEIEEIRGVAVAKGTIDVLLETDWIRPRGRRKAPGRPLTYGTTDHFLSHFGLEQLGDLPGLDELKGAGLFDGQLPSGFGVPNPSDDPALREDEDPIDSIELDLGLAPRAEDAPAGESFGEGSEEAAGETAGDDATEAETEAHREDEPREPEARDEEASD